MTVNTKSITERAIERAEEHKDLSYEEMHEFFTDVYNDKVTDNELKSYAKDIPGVEDKVMDNCGTGGDRSGSFNISTTSAFVLASAGVTVAKHGNKSVTSKTGSSDVLQALGVNLNFDAERVAKELNQSNITLDRKSTRL